MHQIPLGNQTAFSPENFTFFEKDVIGNGTYGKLLGKLRAFVNIDF